MASPVKNPPPCTKKTIGRSSSGVELPLARTPGEGVKRLSWRQSSPPMVFSWKVIWAQGETSRPRVSSRRGSHGGCGRGEEKRRSPTGGLH